MPDYELIKEMVDAIDDRGTGLTDWERSFLTHVKSQWKQKQWLSSAQIVSIQKIYNDRTPDGKRSPLSFNTISGLTPAQKLTQRWRDEGRDEFGPGRSGRERLAREKGYDD